MGIAALSAIRALLILEYFEKVRSPLSLKAITTQLDLPSSSTAALLKSLADMDYLTYDLETRTYLPTLRLASLGGWVPKRIMEDGVLDLVGRLRERTQETIVIATLNDLYVEAMDFKISHRYSSIYPVDEDLGYPRGVAAVTCPMAWHMIKDYKISRLERIYYRSKAKHFFDEHAFTWEIFSDRIGIARQSKYILAMCWPYPSSAVLTTSVPVLPFGRRVALGVGASIERMQEILPALLDLVDGELARLPNTGKGFTGGGEIRQRVAEVDVSPGFLASRLQ